MSFKRFISGVCAFAVAVTAFAAVTVTASAEIHKETITIPSDVQYSRMKSYVDGTVTVQTLTANQYAYLYKDFRNFPYISDASEVTVEFDTVVNNGNMVYFGVGDASQRSGIANTSGTYLPNGLAMYFGSQNGTNYGAYDIKAGKYAFTIQNGAIGQVVHAKFIFDRTVTPHRFTYKIGNQESTLDTDITNLTYLDAYTNKSGGTFKLYNIKVSYTVPTEPTAGTPEPVDLGETATGDGIYTIGDGVYAKAYTCDITYDGIAIENVMVEVPGSNEVSQTISFGNGYSGNVLIGIILASKDPAKINDTPTVTANVN